MVVRRFDQAADFAARAEPFLLTREAENNLILGLAATLIQQPEAFSQEPPFFATIERAGAVVLAALRTPPLNLILSLAADPAAPAALADALAGEVPDLPGLIGPAAEGRTFADRWQATTGRVARREVAERIYALDAVTPPPGVPGDLRRATEADRPLLRAWMTDFAMEAFGLDAERAGKRADGAINHRLASPIAALYLWWDAAPVALVGYAGPTPNGMRVGPVYTPPAHRRRGYASAATAAVSQLLLDRGRRFCVLYTDLANPTSNRIYQQIGYQPVGDADEYAFVAAGTASGAA